MFLLAFKCLINFTYEEIYRHVPNFCFVSFPRSVSVVEVFKPCQKSSDVRNKMAFIIDTHDFTDAPNCTYFQQVIPHITFIALYNHIYLL